MNINETDVLNALKVVIDPDLNKDIVTLGFIKDLEIKEDKISFKIELTTPACPVKDQLYEQALEVVQKISGTKEVEIEMTARIRAQTPSAENLLPNVKHCIAIASGKGGVGKSTLTINLAIALAQKGANVGILDADVYGPSIPLMLGCEQERPYTREGKIMPIERYGIQLMSIGFLLEPDQAVLWRGPMVAGTIKQLLGDVEWSSLDYLLIDLPPGTGDASMSLAQLVPLTGVVIVTTPHRVASQIAGKSAALFKRLNAPLIGVIENMSSIVCPCCKNTIEIFSGEYGKELARDLKIPFLGSIPLSIGISESSAEGTPAIIENIEQPYVEAFHKVAGQLASQISIVSLS